MGKHDTAGVTAHPATAEVDSGIKVVNRLWPAARQYGATAEDLASRFGMTHEAFKAAMETEQVGPDLARLLRQVARDKQLPPVPLSTYLDSGLLADLVPVRSGTKAPIGDGWQSRPSATGDDLEGWAREGHSVGLVHRRVQAIDIDVDDKAAAAALVAVLEKRLPSSPVRLRGTSPRCVFFLRVPEVGRWNAFRFRLPTDAPGAQLHGVEYRAGRTQTVIEGLHPSGVRYHWRGASLAAVGLDGLPALALDEVDALMCELRAAVQALSGTVVTSDRPASARSADGPLRPDKAVWRAICLRRSEWVLGLLGIHAGRADREWRVSSVELERDLDEDLVIYPDGIHDFGSERTHTPVSLIMEFGSVGAAGEIGYGGSPAYGDDYAPCGEPDATVVRPTRDQVMAWLCRRLGREASAEELVVQEGLPALARACGLRWDELEREHAWALLGHGAGEDADPAQWTTAAQIARHGARLPALRAIDPVRFDKLMKGWDFLDLSTAVEGAVAEHVALAQAGPLAPAPQVPTAAGTIDGRDPADAAVARLNGRHAMVMAGGRTTIVTERAEGQRLDVTFSRPSDIREWYADDQIKVGDKTLSVYEVWRKSAMRRKFERVDFDPAGASPNVYNLWRGFAVQPDPKASCALFLAHVRENVCGGREPLFRWLLNYLAHLVQRPWEKPGTAIVLRGGQGVGKSIVGQYVGRLFPPHYVTVSQPRQLTGQFNAHLAQALLVQAEEAFWAGDKAAEGALKDLVTNDVQLVEPKGVDAFRVRNCLRLMITSNHEWVVPAGADERRFAIFDVSQARQQDQGYFGDLAAEMAGGGPAGLLAYLQASELDPEAVRKIPQTEGLLDQKLHSLKDHEAWWFQCLQRGAVGTFSREWMDEHAKSVVFDDFAEFVKRRRSGRAGDIGLFFKHVGQLVPGMQTARKRATDGSGSRVYCVAFPPLDACRADFERHLGQKLSWE